MKTRKYKSGSRWAFWRWTITPSEYITRLHLIMTPWFSICLHWINKPDAEPHLHDHPVTFLSLILRGWYKELRHTENMKCLPITGYKVADTWKMGMHKRRWWNFIRASHHDAHRIDEVSPGGALTLCLMGPKRRDWGFHVEDKWVYWRDYNAANYG